MSDINYQLKVLENTLAKEEKMLAAISNVHNHDETEKRHKLNMEQLKAGIAKLVKWEKDQEILRRASRATGTVEELQDTVKGVYPEAKE